MPPPNLSKWETVVYYSHPVKAESILIAELEWKYVAQLNVRSHHGMNEPSDNQIQLCIFSVLSAPE